MLGELVLPLLFFINNQNYDLIGYSLSMCYQPSAVQPGINPRFFIINTLWLGNIRANILVAGCQGLLLSLP